MSKRILVVEDQPDSRRIIRDMLAPTGYQVTEAENGEEALAAIAKQRPDLILMVVQRCPLLRVSRHRAILGRMFVSNPTATSARIFVGMQHGSPSCC
jgi:DNA-binding response OmpR family regulator